MNLMHKREFHKNQLNVALKSRSDKGRDDKAISFDSLLLSTDQTLISFLVYSTTIKHETKLQICFGNVRSVVTPGSGEFTLEFVENVKVPVIFLVTLVHFFATQPWHSPICYLKNISFYWRFSYCPFQRTLNWALNFLLCSFRAGEKFHQLSCCREIEEWAADIFKWLSSWQERKENMASIYLHLKQRFGKGLLKVSRLCFVKKAETRCCANFCNYAEVY